MNFSRLAVPAALVAIALASCQKDAVKPHVPDAGPADAGAASADAGAQDAGSEDAGLGDAGLEDAGPAPVDAGPEDAGPEDAGSADAGPPPDPSTPGIPCTDTIANVYVTPAGLPPMTAANQGDIVRCAVDVALDVSDVKTQLAGQSVVGVTATSGSNTFRIAYRTWRDDGVPGVGTARVFLPTTPISTPLPVIVSAHGSDGLGQTCAPSMDPTGNGSLNMPFAGTGYAVIAPDYAGLGNGGVQGYEDNLDQAHSTLDAARALRNMLAPGALSSKVILAGYSEGGGASLAAQAIASTYGAGGDLAGVVVFAAEYPTRLNSFQYVTSLNDPTGITSITAGITNPVIYVLRQYAYQYNEVGPSSVANGFPASLASSYDAAASTQCLAEAGAVIDGEGLHNSDLWDPTMASELLACINGNGTGASCTGTGQALYTFLTNNILTSDPSGAPVVYIQGLLDTIMVPAQEAACNIEKMQMDGLNPQVCTDPEGEHTTVVARNVAFALTWVQAILNGATLPACSSSGMPACTP